METTVLRTGLTPLRLKAQLAKLDLLVLDELGYVQPPRSAPSSSSTSSSTAYERTSMIVTTNLPFESWTEVLGSERLTGATLDRLTHRCRIIETKGESYRLHDSKTRSRSKSQPRAHRSLSRRAPPIEISQRRQQQGRLTTLTKALPLSTITRCHFR